MTETQPLLEPELDIVVERYAEKAGLSKAEVIRLCVLSKFAPLPPIEEDPFFKLSRSPIEGTPNDSRSIDEVVYGPSNPDP